MRASSGKVTVFARCSSVSIRYAADLEAQSVGILRKPSGRLRIRICTSVHVLHCSKIRVKQEINSRWGPCCRSLFHSC